MSEYYIDGGGNIPMKRSEAEIADLKKANELLHKLMFNRGAEIERLRKALESLLQDPPATLDEPDTDAEVIIKMRAIVRDALCAVGIAGDTP